MFNQVSYNVIIERFKAFASGHLQLQRFSHGQITTNHLDLAPENTFPWMHVVPVSVQPVNGAHAFTFDVLFCELPRDKEDKVEYQREAISDTIRLAEDLLAEVRNGGVIFGEDVVLREGATIVPFMEEYTYVLTGVTLTLTMEFPWDWSACDIPATWVAGGTGSGSGGGGGVGLVLRVNGTNNEVQTILDLVNGDGISVEDLGDGRVRITNTGGALSSVATEYTANHTTATGNQYIVGDRVWYNGSVYQCIASNDAIIPTNTAYWLLVGVGNRLRQTPADWNATNGDGQILNKPNLAAVATSGDYNDLINTPSQPGLQAVIATDANLTSNNVIEGNGTALEFNNLASYEVNALDSFNGFGGNLEVLPDLSKLKSEDVNTGNEVFFAVGSGVTTYIKTAAITSGATNGDVLTLVDKTTGEVEYSTPAIGGLTSVGLITGTAIDAIVISGSPLTANGDILLTSGGNGTQYVDGNLQLQTMPTGLPPTGAAGGDLTGTYPDPTVHRLHGTDVQAGTPTDGDVLLYHATNGRWQHQHIHTGQVDNNSAVSGATASDALETLNTNKVTANAAITAGTATKITYDAKGLVTGGVAITAADLPSGIDATKIGGGAVSNTEFNYLDGVTSAIQTQINNLGLPTLNVRGTAVAGVAVGATTATSCGLTLSLPSGTADRTYHIEAVWMLAPTFNPTGGGRVGFSWSGSILNFHGSFQGSASEISYRSVSATAITSGGLHPGNTPYFASDIARSAIAPTTFRGYLDVAANSTTAITLTLAAVTGGATITFYPRGSYIRATRVS